MVSAARANALFAVFLAGAAAMLGLHEALRRQWVPFDTLANAPLVFMHYRLPHAALWWDRYALVYAFWTVGAILCVLFARSISAALGKAFLPAVLIVQAAALGAMLASPLPMDSDQYAYVYYASLTQRGVNPYVHYTRPLKLTHTEQRIAAHWDNPPYIDRYGAGWTLANAAILAPFHNAPVEVQVRILRFAASLAALACTLLLWIALRRFAWRANALLAFAFNPLIIVASANGGHNDVYLLLLGLAAYLLAERRRYELAACALAASVQTKFAYAPFILPLLAVTFATTRSWLRTAASAVIFAVTLLVFSIPLGLKLSLYDVAVGFNASHPPMYSYFWWRVFYHLGLHHSTLQIFALLFPLFAVACAIGVSWLALHRRREPLLELALFMAILLLPYKIESWYGVMLAPMLLIPRRWATAAYLGVTATCEFLERRIFFGYDHPYVIANALGVLAAIAVWYVMERTRGWAAVEAQAT